MLLVCDANVLVSGVFGQHRLESKPGELVRRILRGDVTLVLSEPIVDEFERTLTKPYFVARMDEAVRRDAFAALVGIGRFVSPTRQVRGVATHPEDDLVLAAALSADADFLVTGDKKLQALGIWEGIVILDPAAFLAILDNLPAQADDAPS